METVKETGRRMVAWGIYLNGKLLNTVFYASDCDADWVYNGVVIHDDYDPAITVRRQTT